ncbi:MAG: DNA topoisomerase IV subunit A [Candidatus Delongbacteria bacterium]|nr:DNA topoisomerase IV subunit A [Candidatus Delongbacteria bacterium]MBN2834526.1 DNA topoisomerase IV subunit A [Candidatus Delongbacteria bacterium]
MTGLKDFFDLNFIEYANYVVKYRAIPDIDDGLKPVQRRVLHSMFELDDGKFNKVANIVGNTMKYHPHGDASIYESLVNLANKDLFIEKQGNFGNIFTGDRAAAARYIEARLTPLAKEVFLNKELTDYIDSYDGRNREPVTFPAKIPVLLLLGSEGIGVGMSTKILPHNFIEVLEAQIKYLKNEEFVLYPDFINGGTMDVSEYKDGDGKVKVRADIDVLNEKTIIIRSIPYGTTTESIIASIEKMAKKGKLKIASINDFTAAEIEIEIILARGYKSSEAISALYAFSECEISISPQSLCIKDSLPTNMRVTEVLKYCTDRLVGILKKELELKLYKLKEDYHYKTLAQIFIEKRMYKKIEEIETYEEVVLTVISGFDKYKNKLKRDVTESDAEKLLTLQIKRISRFDINKNRKEIEEILAEIEKVKENLSSLIPYTINYLEYLIATYGKNFERKTSIDDLETITAKDAAIENIKLFYDRKTGYMGTAVKSDTSIWVSEFSDIILFYRDGSYKVVRVMEKSFIGKNIIYFNKADNSDAKDRTYSVVYRDKASKLCYIKRFKDIKYILDKEYRYLPDESKLEYFTIRKNLQFTCYLERLPRMRSFMNEFNLEDYRVKGVAASGVRIIDKNIIKFKVEKIADTEIDESQHKQGEEFLNDEKAETLFPEEPSLFDFDEE